MIWDIVAMICGVVSAWSALLHSVNVGHRVTRRDRLRIVTHALAGILLFYSGVSPYLDGPAYDNSAYMQIVQMSPLESTAAPGDLVPVQYTVFKRPGCKGQVRTFAQRPDGRDTIELSALVAAWPDGEGTHTYPYPLTDDMPLGEWDLRFSVKSRCQAVDGFAATAPGVRLVFTSRPVRVTVIDPSERVQG